VRPHRLYPAPFGPGSLRLSGNVGRVDHSVASNQGARPKRGLIGSVWTRAALALAVIEGILIIVGVIPRWTAVLVAGVVLAVYFLGGRNATSPTGRQAIWAVALSQAVVLFVPLVLWILGAVVIVAVAAVAAIVLIALVLDR
jgi:hypothetical protein